MREFLEKNYTDEAIETDGLTIKLVIKALLEVSLPLRSGRAVGRPRRGSVPPAGWQGWRPRELMRWLHRPRHTAGAGQGQLSYHAGLRGCSCCRSGHWGGWVRWGWEPEGSETVEVLEGGARGRRAGPRVCCAQVGLQEAGGGRRCGCRDGTVSGLGLVHGHPCKELSRGGRRGLRPFSLPPPQVVQSGGKNIELAVMRRDQPLKVKAQSGCARGGTPRSGRGGGGSPRPAVPGRPDMLPNPHLGLQVPEGAPPPPPAGAHQKHSLW